MVECDGDVLKRGALAVGALGCALLAPAPASAAEGDAIIQRTQLGYREVRAPDSELDGESLALAQRVDALLYEAVQDLGLSVDVSERPEMVTRDRSEGALLERAAEHWVFAPSLRRERGQLVLRIAAVPPASRIIYVRAQSVDADELDMRVALMMRDLVQVARGRSAPETPTDSGYSPRTVLPTRSSGRAILALNAGLLGGYAGYSLQQASGSADDRLTYPLVALGAGVGLGSSMLVAEEWDVGVGDAWFLSAGTWWPTFAGFLLSESYGANDDDRYAYGLLGATIGLSLGTAVLSFGHVTDGGAALAHSGAAFGTLLGGLSELFVVGATDEAPRRGMGYGASAGLLAAAALSTQLDMPAGRVLLIDLGASLGALTGAAAASPLLLVEEGQKEAAPNRLWLASIGAGTLVGGLVGWWSTRTSGRGQAATPPTLLPSLGLIAGSPEGPVFGASLQGAW